MKKIIQKLLDKIRQLTGEPKTVARSFAMGSFIGVSPLIGMQIMLSLLLATVFKLSKSAAVVGVINTNWTKGAVLYPVNYKLGAWLLGVNPVLDVKGLFTGNIFQNIFSAGTEVFVSLLIGGFITGLILATAYYYLVLKVLNNRNLIVKKADIA